MKRHFALDILIETIKIWCNVTDKTAVFTVAGILRLKAVLFAISQSIFLKGFQIS